MPKNVTKKKQEIYFGDFFLTQKLFCVTKTLWQKYINDKKCLLIVKVYLQKKIKRNKKNFTTKKVYNWEMSTIFLIFFCDTKSFVAKNYFDEINFHDTLTMDEMYFG